jgi:6,7-dimethyl-8-ribityllumazine synthase
MDTGFRRYDGYALVMRLAASCGELTLRKLKHFERAGIRMDNAGFGAAMSAIETARLIKLPK